MTGEPASPGFGEEAADGSAESFMRIALREAEKGLGRTRPNPAVGALVVKEGRILAKGHHEHAGGPHAEVVALRAAGALAAGADLYSTLEPCDHYGRTPPCSRAIAEAGIRRVFVGSSDPNPQVNGRGIERLRQRGVEVVTDVLRGPCDALGAPWFHYIRTGRPYVTLAVEPTPSALAPLDRGASPPSSPDAHEELHRLRDRVDAVLVGAGMARQHDPELVTRLIGKIGHDPVRVVLDTQLSLPPSLRLFNVKSCAETLVATASATGVERPGVGLLRCAPRDGRIDLEDLLARLGERGITHLLVEGGTKVCASFLAAGLVDDAVLLAKRNGHGASSAADAGRAERVGTPRAPRMTIATGR